MRSVKIALILMVILSIVTQPATLLMAMANETPALMLTGTSKAPSVLRNIDFTDVRASNTWAKPAIYESSALELMKGNNRVFGINNVLTVDQAIAIGYNAIGREADAQKAAEALDLARAKNSRLFPAPRMWSDGYIQLAYTDGLISLQDYNDAFSANQLSLSPTSFLRNASATREDVAYYLGKLLGLTPVNSQTRIFNSYRDWTSADPHKIPYIEAMLQNRIMGDDGRGRFNPKSYITRAEMAQVLVNAEPIILAKLGYQKMKGTVESVAANQDLSDGKRINEVAIRIRNSGGALHQLTSIESLDNGTAKNEQTGNSENLVSSSVVNRSNTLSLAGTLKAGEQIVYFVNASNEVLYIQVISTKTDIRYYLGKVSSVDSANKKVGFSKYVELPFSDIRLADSKTISKIQPTNTTTLYSVSSSVKVFENGEQGGFDRVRADGAYVITVKNGVIDTFEQTDVGLMEESGLVSGIVKEVNPSLGYITLYFSDGSGTTPELSEKLAELRTYSYAYDVPVYRDGRSTGLESITPGDYAFIKLDEDGYIAQMSAESYYRPVYGTVHLKGPNYLVLKLTDGTFKNYAVTANTPVHRNAKPSSLYEIAPGDSVRLLVQNDGENQDIAGIELTKNAPLITAVYRGDVETYNDMNDTLTLSRVQEFVNGRWEETPFIGAKPFVYSEAFSERPSDRAGGKAYIVVKKDSDGKDKIFMAAFRNAPQYETTLTDNLMRISSSAKRLELENTSEGIGFDANTIAIKDGRLIDVASLNILDPVSISAEKTYGTNDYISHVLVSNTPSQNGSLTVYRGRIKTVDPLKSFTLESFAQLSGTSWMFSNTPKTFDIDLSVTRLVEGDGVGNMRQFDTDYQNQSVYVVTNNAKTMLISTAPYADVVLSGRVESLTGITTNDNGDSTTPPTGFKLKEVLKYNGTSFIWENASDLDVNMPVHSIVIKNGTIQDISAIRPGDSVRVITNRASNDGVIILVN